MALSKAPAIRTVATVAKIPRTTNVARVPRSVPQISIARTRLYTTLSHDTPAAKYSYQDVKKLIKEGNPDVVLVDVREPNEFANGAIPGAVNIPIKSKPGALGLEPEEFLDEFGFDKPKTDQKLVFYCLAGVRSTMAEELAATFGYQNRGNYVGSYEDWVKNEQSSKQD